MLSRRGFIRAGAATVGTLALRPFGLLPALAQSSANYRALVCVFLFGGNDSNNTVIPMDDASYQAYTSIRGSLALSASELTPTVYSVSNAPFAFHGKLAEVASMFSSKELAVVANTGSLVQPLTRSAISRLAGAHSAQSVLAFRPAVAMADFHRAGQQPHRLGRTRGGLSQLAKDQLLELSRRSFRWRAIRWRAKAWQRSRWRSRPDNR